MNTASFGLRYDYFPGSYFSILVCRALIAEATSLSCALTLGVGLTFHNLRYKALPVSETVPLRRMCSSDEEMSNCMTRHEMISTIAEAGAKLEVMDVILTALFTYNSLGKFSITQPLNIEGAAKVGLILRIGSDLAFIWIDLEGVRALKEESDRWFVIGKYKNYLNLTQKGRRTKEVTARYNP